MLYLRNYDKPGFIGTLGTLMGELGLNIATFHLGRKQAGGEAVALIEIDGTVDKQTLGAIRDLPQIVRAIICALPRSKPGHGKIFKMRGSSCPKCLLLRGKKDTSYRAFSPMALFLKPPVRGIKHDRIG